MKKNTTKQLPLCQHLKRKTIGAWKALTGIGNGSMNEPEKITCNNLMKMKSDLLEYFEPYDNTGWKIVVDGQVSVIAATGTLNYASEAAVKKHIKSVLDSMAECNFDAWRLEHDRLQEIDCRKKEIREIEEKRKAEVLIEKPYSKCNDHYSADGFLRTYGTEQDIALHTEDMELWREMVDLEDKARRKFRTEMKKWNNENQFITYIYA